MIRKAKKIGVILIFVILIYTLSNNIINYRQRMNYFQQYVNNYEEAVEKNRKLKTEIVNQKDLYKLEKDVRDKLGRSKPGETVLVLPEITPAATPTPTPVIPVYRQWINLFTP